MSKYTLEFFQKIARTRDGQCLSGVYTNLKTKLNWQCSKGHTWLAIPSSILYTKTWCIKCRDKNNSVRQLGKIEDLHVIAQKRGGKCLSTEYSGVRYKAKWQCSMEHKWEARIADIKRGTWCPKCANYNKNRKYFLNDLYHMIELKGGKCLSHHANLLQIECENKHIWNTKSKNLIRGAWCSICHCNKQKITIEQINDRLKNRLKNTHIKCLNIIHTNKKTEIELSCSKNHTWISNLSAIRRKGGCPICSKRKKYTIEYMKNLATKNKGKCLSQKYIKNCEHLQWECANNHRWYTTPRSVLNGSWCPTCSCFYTVNEEKCRFILQSLLSINFPKNNRAVKPLELDGYNEPMKLAFEYNGEQHYYFIRGLHKTFDKFIKQKKRDKQKIFLCQQKGIELIIIPYTKAQSDDTLIPYIRNSVKILFPNIFLNKVNMKTFSYRPEKLKELNETARKRGGKCLSTTYVNSKSHLKWECKNEHTWNTNPSTIKRGCWCPECAIDKKRKIKENA